jgi:hypothetical protein
MAATSHAAAIPLVAVPPAADWMVTDPIVMPSVAANDSAVLFRDEQQTTRDSYDQ